MGYLSNMHVILEKKIFYYLFENSHTYKNFTKIVRVLFTLLLVFHLMSCIWIFIGRTHEGWVTQLPEEAREDKGFIYVTALYFITASSTTVGYGDFAAENRWEMTYSVFQEFSSIILFSIISANIISIQFVKSVKTYIEEKENQAKNILYTLDQMEGIEFDDEIYDSTIKYFKDSYLHGV
eukprot:CAMPEP_0170565778 /NCGR_PEP_ID=MMETSP0211-20121228/79406_1 /TAXON_ID=311385 /ORGANISM="Pseudokeronopsis sp., Strain OXSARD2" /LENGTH=179 /DNA_ID=CAMNT_0010886743 /DNA_START=872 /DNA_END=1411 /DNA_ORIENTATION=-